jgi:filamentous hemagglutinin family protein
MIKTKLWLSFLTLIGLNLNTQTANAQTYQPSNRTPVADSTLGTQVSGSGNNFNITGGLNRGQTLFHSFSDFSVPTNGQANFTNPVGNRDIITRVTGTIFSDINGLVNTNGANFFLINPNGIVFGTNAQLNVGRAFMASTANGLNLVDGAGSAITFGTNTNSDPLLKIAPNVLFNVSSLTIGGGNGQISNFGTLETTNPNQYIGLIGGNVTFNGGGITAPAAKVELGGLVQSGTVGFSLNDGVLLPTNVERGNVSLVSNGTIPSLINVESGGGGSVTIFAQDITLQGAGTRIRAGIAAGLGSPTAIAGDIKLNATGDVSFSDKSDIRNRVNLGSQGQSGDIEVITRNLSFTSGAGLVGGTVGKGDAGNIRITATGNVYLDGIKDGLNSGAFSTVASGAVGKAGGVDISARNLWVTNGAQLQALTRGQGDAGTVKITAIDNVTFDGEPSGVFSSVSSGAVGKGGGVEIFTRNLWVTNGAGLNATTFGRGDAGTVKITATDNVTFDGIRNGSPSKARSTVAPGAIGKGGGVEISTRNLSVTNGANLNASTLGRGDAGTVKITATGNVSFDGRKDGSSSGGFSTVESGAVGKAGGVEISTRNLWVTNGAQLQALTRGQGDAGIVKITATDNVSLDGIKDGFNSGAFSVVEEGAVGKGGGVEVSARTLSVTNGAFLDSGSRGQGNAGNLVLKSDRIFLNGGGIESIASTSTGGDIAIVAKDFLILRNNSSIATNSASTGADGNGGNITIDSPAIVAMPGDNDITANAVRGNGGRINITSQGLFGIQFRPKGQDSLTTNDITASSTFGRDGNVNIDTPGTDPGRDSTELPNTTTDASNQISQVCSANNRQNKLTVAGRGGLPPNANDPLTSDVVWQDARAASNQPAIGSAITNPLKLAPPAVGWVFDGKGKVTLIAAATPGQPTGTQVVCPNVK